MTLIKPFSGLGKHDAAIAGGKGASLGEMTQAGIPVPPGFVILSEAFEQFIKETDLNVEIDAILHTVNPAEMHTVEGASEKIQALILNAKMPEDIKTSIESFFKDLDAEYVAVRSSATAEDSASAAWAGQLDSFLNTNKDTLLENVQRCWASLFTPRAIFYRFEKELHTTKISVAVVVQKMVESEVSGIAFSVHPVTEDRNQLIIEAGFGLGEAIVSGSVTPDSYVVEKEPRRIIDTNVSTQTRALHRAKSGAGDEWQDIPEPKASSQVLTEAQIFELSEIILRIETHYGFPCDIEWAFENNTFYIVQSRPITTLSNVIEQNSIRYTKTLERDATLFVQGSWARALNEDLEVVIGEKNPCGPMVLHHIDSGNLQVWENLAAVQWMLDAFLERNNKSAEFITKVINDYRKDLVQLGDFWKQKSIKDKQGIQRYTSLVRRASLGISTCYYVGMDERTPEAIQQMTLEVRETDIFYSRNDEFVQACVAALAPQLSSLAQFVLPDELANIPSQDELERRSKGCYLLAGRELVVGSKEDLIKVHPEIRLEGTLVDTGQGVRGQTAYPGKLQGRVIIVKNKRQMNVVDTEDILVAPMTTPDFLPAMQKAAAFVTDEGGITCHAAIVAREMKKPCIIGTKVATQVLKDGDLVEVDADRGVVTVLERAK